MDNLTDSKTDVIFELSYHKGEKMKQEYAKKINRPEYIKDLDVCLDKVNTLISEMNKINDDIKKADNIIKVVSNIPDITKPETDDLREFGYTLQQGLIVNSVPAGQTAAQNAIDYSKNFEYYTENIIGKSKEYIERKSRLWRQKTLEYNVLKNTYNRLIDGKSNFKPLPAIPSFILK